MDEYTSKRIACLEDQIDELQHALASVEAVLVTLISWGGDCTSKASAIQLIKMLGKGD